MPVDVVLSGEVVSHNVGVAWCLTCQRDIVYGSSGKKPSSGTSIAPDMEKQNNKKKTNYSMDGKKLS